MVPGAPRTPTDLLSKIGFLAPGIPVPGPGSPLPSSRGGQGPHTCCAREEATLVVSLGSREATALP